MSSSIKNVYQFRTTSKITQAQGAASTFTIGNDVFTNSSVTITGGSVKLENRTGSQVELMTITATGGTATIANRGILPDGTTSIDYQYERPRNTLCTVTVLERQIFDKTSSDPILLSAFEYADAAARDAALGGDGVATKNYTNVKTLDDGLFWRYNTTTGQWEDIDTGTTTPNASETVSGSTEVPTQTQADAGEDTLDTGAFGSITPMRAGRSVQKNAWIKGTDAGGDDAYEVTLTPAPTAYVDGMEILLKATTANTGACSVNVNALGVKSIKTPGGNDPQNGDIPAGKWKRLRYNGTDFIIVDGHQATTEEIGSPEMATDAEALAGMDQTRYINSLQLLASKTYNQTSTKVEATGANGTSNTSTINLSTKGGFASVYCFVINTSGSNRSMNCRLQISNDGSSWSTLNEIINVNASSTSNAANYIRSYSCIISKGKYIRGEVYTSGSGSSAYIEITYQALS